MHIGLDYFLQQLPKKTLYLKGERCAGGKHSKVCLIGLAAGNGVDKKHPMFIIGKSKMPRCFKGVKSLPYQYESQKKARMDSASFEQFVQKLQMKFHWHDTKVALIIDNYPIHPRMKNLTLVEFVFLPPNTT